MTKTIYLAAGCFWGAQHYLKQIRGVVRTATGFANGDPSLKEPTYEEVYTDRTGYAETVMVEFDPDVLTLRKLLELYFLSIDPTAVNQQGEDSGTRYRTGIYYIDQADYPTIMEVYRNVQHGYSSPLAVEVEPLKVFHPASEYHQDYLEKHPDGYCHLPEALFEFARKSNADNLY
ncbi:MAG: peptide-methionine (S)-S-oxide reductase MsrA [Bacteroidales bacterium]|nr:peptide-methionine (S)-S-oxide reductase MsrA [Bacteroidales bacterium]